MIFSCDSDFRCHVSFQNTSCLLHARKMEVQLWRGFNSSFVSLFQGQFFQFLARHAAVGFDHEMDLSDGKQRCTERCNPRQCSSKPLSTWTRDAYRPHTGEEWRNAQKQYEDIALQRRKIIQSPKSGDTAVLWIRMCSFQAWTQFTCICIYVYTYYMPLHATCIHTYPILSCQLVYRKIRCQRPCPKRSWSPLSWSWIGTRWNFLRCLDCLRWTTSPCFWLESARRIQDIYRWV